MTDERFLCSNCGHYEGDRCSECGRLFTCGSIGQVCTREGCSERVTADKYGGEDWDCPREICDHLVAPNRDPRPLRPSPMIGELKG